MARLATNRDYYLKTLLLDGFREADKTKDKYMDWYIETPLLETTAKIKYYKDIPTTLFISGDQIYHGQVKFLQIGINEDNYNHRYKSFAEMLGTIRYLIENYVVRYNIWKYDGEIRVWLHIDKETLIPELWIYELDDKSNNWRFVTIIEAFDTGVVLDYIGIDMYDIDSRTTVTKIKEKENEFKKALDDVIYEHLSETPSQPHNQTNLIEVVKDKIYINDTFSFPFYLSHLTLAPLIEYLVKFFEIDPHEEIKLSQDSIQNYLEAVFEEDCFSISGHVLNKRWFCDFGLLSKCNYDVIEYNNLDNKKELFNKYVIHDEPSELGNFYQLAWYLFTKDCPRIIIDYVITKCGSYDRAILVFNSVKLIYDMLMFEYENIDTKKFIRYLLDEKYISNICKTIENSQYIKHLIYDKLDSSFFINTNYKMFVDELIQKFLSLRNIMSFDELITNVIESDFKKYCQYKLPKINNE